MPTPNLELTNPLAGSESADDLEEELERAFDQIECTEYVVLPAPELTDWADLEVEFSPDGFPR